MIPFGYFRVPRGGNLWLGITYELAKFPSHPLAQDFDLLLLIYSSRFCYFSYTLFRVFIFVFRLISYYHKLFKNAIVFEYIFYSIFYNIKWFTSVTLPIYFCCRIYNIFNFIAHQSLLMVRHNYINMTFYAQYFPARIFSYRKDTSNSYVFSD